jgi:hypothetical protein
MDLAYCWYYLDESLTNEVYAMLKGLILKMFPVMADAETNL